MRLMDFAIRALPPGPALVPVVAYLVFLGCAGLGIVQLLGTVVDTVRSPVDGMMMLGDGTLTDATPGQYPAVLAAQVLEGDTWLQDVKSKWQSRDRSNAQSGGGEGGAYGRLGGPSSDWTDPDRRRGKAQTASHRTVCVRLCDGYFFPISFATTDDQFAKDQETCSRSCSSPAKLYVYQNPGQDPEQMVDMDGRPYTKLSTAFQFRSTFDQTCKCTPHPWEQAALDRHRQYAEHAAKKPSERRADAAATSTKRGAVQSSTSIRTVSAASLPVASDTASVLQAALPVGARSNQLARPVVSVPAPTVAVATIAVVASADAPSGRTAAAVDRDRASVSLKGPAGGRPVSLRTPPSARPIWRSGAGSSLANRSTSAPSTTASWQEKAFAIR